MPGSLVPGIGPLPRQKDASKPDAMQSEIKILKGENLLLLQKLDQSDGHKMMTLGKRLDLVEQQLAMEIAKSPSKSWR